MINFKKYISVIAATVLVVMTLPLSVFAASDSIDVRLASGSPDERSVDQGENEVEFIRLEFEGNVDSEVKEIQFTGFGDFDDSDIDNLELINLDTGESLGTESLDEDFTVTFGGDFDVDDGEEVEVSLRGDIADDARIGAEIGFKVSDDSDIEADDNDRDELEVDGAFPIRGEYVVVGSENGVTLTVSDDDPSGQVVDRGSDDVTLFEFELTTGEEEITIEEIVLTAYGDFDEDDISNFRLMDVEEDDQLSRFNDLRDRTVIFDDPFDIQDDTTMILALVADIDEDATNGSEIGFKFADDDDIDAEEEGSGDTVRVVGNFPLRSNLTRIGSADGFEVSLSNGSPDAELIDQGENEVVFIEVDLSSPEDVEVQEMTFEVFGTFDSDDFDDFRLIDLTDNEDTISRADIDGDTINFDDKFSIKAGRTKRVAITADVDNDARVGATLGFKIRRATAVVVEDEDSGDEIDVEGDFPIEGELQTVSVGEGLAITLGSDNPGDMEVRPGSQDIVFMEIVLNSDEDVEIEQIIFKSYGDHREEHFEDFQLIDKDTGDVLGFERILEDGRITFEDDFDLDADEPLTLVLRGDSSETIAEGDDLGFKISQEGNVYAQYARGNDEIEIIDTFPLNGPVITFVENPQNNDEDEEDENDSSDDISDDDRPKLPEADFDDDVLNEDDYKSYANPFPDTDEDELEGRSAAELNRRGVISGYPDGEFKGDNFVLRAEAAKMLLLARYMEVEEIDNNGQFSDVEEGQWFVRYVVTAANLDIINGYPDGTFGPGNTVNTVEFLKMLTLTFDLEVGLDHDYSDVPEGVWYEQYAGTAQRYDLFPTRDSDQLQPARFMTRTEVAVAIFQYLLNR